MEKSKQEERKHGGRTLAMTIVREEWNILKEWSCKRILSQWTGFVHKTVPGAGCSEVHSGCEINMEKLCVLSCVSMWDEK